MRLALLILAAVVLVAGWLVALRVDGFSSHMMAHMLVVAVAAPLLAVGVRRRPTFLGEPLAALGACGFELLVVWGWHAPVLHMAARANTGVFVLEQASFLLAGYAVWASALPPLGRSPAKSSALPGVGALLVTSMHMSLLGGLLAVAPVAWYHAGGGDAVLADQHLGGVIMLGVGGVCYLAGALVLLGRSLAVPTGWREAP